MNKNIGLITMSPPQLFTLIYRNCYSNTKGEIHHIAAYFCHSDGLTFGPTIYSRPYWFFYNESTPAEIEAARKRTEDVIINRMEEFGHTLYKDESQ